jgi:glutamine amidotransferase
MTENARAKGRPFLGVCVGMQLLADRGLEFGETPGLGWIGGEVRLIKPADHALKVPHMGWNVLTDRASHPLFAGLPDETHMYFTHSFAFHAADPADVIAQTDHGGPFAAAIARGNVAGVQFHPEKSQAAGLALLANFLEWRP